MLPRSHLVHAATRASAALVRSNTWYHVMASKVRQLLHKDLPSFRDLTEPRIDEIIAAVRPSLTRHMLESLHTSPKAYLMHSSMFTNRSRPILQFRPYLTIQTTAHRRTLTKLICSDHPLAIERLWWLGIPRHTRFCRLCGLDVESPEHALFACPELQDSLLRRREDLSRSILNELALQTLVHVLDINKLLICLEVPSLWKSSLPSLMPRA